MSADDDHLLLGAYVLGGLSESDRRTFSEHLRTCRQCQGELGQVSGLPHLLDLSDPDAVDGLADAGGAGSPPTAGAAAPGSGDVSSLVTRLARRRRRRRVWAGVGAAAATVAVFALGATLGPALLDPEPPTTHVVATAAGSEPVRVDVALVTRGWGTQLDLDCEDLPRDGELLLYVTDAQGRSSSVASWRATPSGYSRVTGATALRPDEIRAVEVRTSSGQVVASARTA
jgi:hypothetical protein